MCKICLVIFFFFPNLVRADYTQFPEKCLKDKVFPCAVRSYRKTHFKVNGFQLFVSKNSLLEFQAKDRIYLSDGYYWIQSENDYTLIGRFGSTQVHKSSQLWIEAIASGWTLRSLGGNAEVYARGDRDGSLLKPGYEVHLGLVDPATKRAQVTLPSVINITYHLKHVSQVFPFSDLNFKDFVENLGRLIASAAEDNAVWNKTIVERKLADIAEEKARLKYESERNGRRDSYLRSLFRKKSNFED